MHYTKPSWPMFIQSASH